MGVRAQYHVQLALDREGALEFVVGRWSRRRWGRWYSIRPKHVLYAHRGSIDVNIHRFWLSILATMKCH